MNLRAILYGLAAIAAASVFVRLFLPKYRSASRWLRTAFALLASAAAAWSTLGFFLLVQESHLSQARSATLSHIESGLAGTFVVMAIVIVIHPEYCKLRSSS